MFFKSSQNGPLVFLGSSHKGSCGFCLDWVQNNQRLPYFIMFCHIQYRIKSYRSIGLHVLSYQYWSTCFIFKVMIQMSHIKLEAWSWWSTTIHYPWDHRSLFLGVVGIVSLRRQNHISGNWVDKGTMFIAIKPTVYTLYRCTQSLYVIYLLLSSHPIFGSHFLSTVVFKFVDV